MENELLLKMIRQAIVESHDELKEEIGNVRTELKEEIASVRTELHDFREEVNRRFDAVDEDLIYVKQKLFDHDKDIFMLKRKVQ